MACDYDSFALPCQKADAFSHSQDATGWQRKKKEREGGGESGHVAS